MVAASYIGSPASAVFILLFLIGTAYLHKNMRLLAGEAALLALLPLAAIIKIFTHRIRPETMYVEHMRFKTYSFPSGHAYASFLVFGFLAFLCIRHVADPWRWLFASLLVGMILLVGVSRVYLGAHFPSDVIGGWLLGGLVLFLVLKFIVK